MAKKKDLVKVTNSRRWGDPKVYHASYCIKVGYGTEMTREEAFAMGLRPSKRCQCSG